MQFVMNQLKKTGIFFFFMCVLFQQGMAQSTWWTEKFKPQIINGQINSVVEYQGKLVVGGNFVGIGKYGASMIAQWDESEGWLPLETPIKYPEGQVVYNLLVVGDTLAVSGSFNSVGLYSNGQWRYLEAGLTQFNIQGYNLFYRDGKYMLGGMVNLTGSEGDRYWVNAAEWDGTRWSAWNESNFNSNANSFIISGNDTVVGGYFTALYGGSKNLGFISRKKGNTWEPMGSGFNSQVMTLLEHRDTLYSIGYFGSDTAGAATYYGIVKWNGTEWKNAFNAQYGYFLNHGFVYENELYVTGTFYNIPDGEGNHGSFPMAKVNADGTVTGVYSTLGYTSAFRGISHINGEKLIYGNSLNGSSTKYHTSVLKEKTDHFENFKLPLAVYQEGKYFGLPGGEISGMEWTGKKLVISSNGGVPTTSPGVFKNFGVFNGNSWEDVPFNTQKVTRLAHDPTTPDEIYVVGVFTDVEGLEPNTNALIRYHTVSKTITPILKSINISNPKLFVRNGYIFMFNGNLTIQDMNSASSGVSNGFLIYKDGVTTPITGWTAPHSFEMAEMDWYDDPATEALEYKLHFFGGTLLNNLAGIDDADGYIMYESGPVGGEWKAIGPNTSEKSNAFYGTPVSMTLYHGVPFIGISYGGVWEENVSKVGALVTWDGNKWAAVPGFNLGGIHISTVAASDSGIFVSGIFFNQGTQFNLHRIAHFNPEQQRWTPVVNSINSPFGQIIAKDGFFLGLGGFTKIDNVIMQYIAVYGPSGFPTSVTYDGPSTANTFELSQNYPNPFNPTTKIKLQLNQSQYIRLTVFDVLGREVKTLLNEIKPAGTYSVEFNALGLPSGVYFYQVMTGDFTQTKKMLLVK